jgi:thioredoxin 1
MALQVTDASFEQDVLNNDKLTLVDFWAEWCGPCKMMNPILEELSTEYEGRVTITKMNVDDNEITPTDFAIRGLPTIVMFKEGKEVGRILGSQTIGVMRSQIEAKLAAVTA